MNNKLKTQSVRSYPRRLPALGFERLEDRRVFAGFTGPGVGWLAEGADMAFALQLRVGKPKLRSTELAETLSRDTGKQVSAAAYRKMVERARDMYAELLSYEVSQSIASTDRNEIESELQALDLFTFCNRS